MKLETVILGQMQTNCYLLSSDSAAVVIDPGDKSEIVENFLFFAKKCNKNLLVLLTHCHFDHISAVSELKNKFDVKVAVGKGDAEGINNSSVNLSAMFGVKIEPFIPDILLEDGQIYKTGDIEIRSVFTPGHTKGGMSYFISGKLFSGDTLFFESIGNDRFLGGEREALLRSVKKLCSSFPDNTEVFPGHGRATTIKHEKEFNPFLNYDNCF